MNFGLLLSQLILFAAAIGLGFAVGWRAYLALAAARLRADKLETDRLRALLSQLQTRRTPP
jgi:hypothetical protein